MVDIRGSRGMGALIMEALILTAHAESIDRVPDIRSSNPLYCPKGVSDLLSHFMGAGAPQKPGGGWPLVFRHFFSLQSLGLNRRLTIPQAHLLFWKYFKPRDVVQCRVNEVLAGVPEARFDLSPHYRGTDKHLEAPPVSHEQFADAVSEFCLAHPATVQVFLATDDLRCEAVLRQRFKELIFTTFELASPLDSEAGKHFSSMRPEDKAVEALGNALLISHAQHCIRTSSYLSALSVIMNPRMTTRTLNTDNWGSTTFPERDILDRERELAAQPLVEVDSISA